MVHFAAFTAWTLPGAGPQCQVDTNCNDEVTRNLFSPHSLANHSPAQFSCNRKCQKKNPFPSCPIRGQKMPRPEFLTANQANHAKMNFKQGAITQPRPTHLEGVRT